MFAGEHSTSALLLHTHAFRVSHNGYMNGELRNTIIRICEPLREQPFVVAQLFMSDFRIQF
jgi:hypothetical protein